MPQMNCSADTLASSDSPGILQVVQIRLGLSNTFQVLHFITWLYLKTDCCVTACYQMVCNNIVHSPIRTCPILDWCLQISVKQDIDSRISLTKLSFYNGQENVCKIPKAIGFFRLTNGLNEGQCIYQETVGDWLLSRFVTISAVVFSMRMSWMSALFLADRSCRFVFARESGTGERSCLRIFSKITSLPLPKATRSRRKISLSAIASITLSFWTGLSPCTLLPKFVLFWGIVE